MYNGNCSSNNIRQRIIKRNQIDSNISKSATNLVAPANCGAKIEFRRKSIGESGKLEENPENAPVLRRRRFTRKQRKSFIIEPETGLILAAAARRESTSSEEESDKNRSEICFNYSNRNSSSNGPAARRASRLLKRAQKHACSTSHLSEMFDGNGLRNQKRSLSVRDLNGDNIDFNNRDSVSRWTSQILAEIDSLPSSSMDLRMNEEISMRSSSIIPRMAYSMIENGSRMKEESKNNGSTTSLPNCARSRGDSIESNGASTVVVQSSDSEPESTPSIRHQDLVGNRDFTRIVGESPIPPPNRNAPPIPAKRTMFLNEKKGVRKRLEEVFSEADRKLQDSISRITQSVYGDLKVQNRFSIPLIRTSADFADQEKESLEKWKKMAECRAKNEEKPEEEEKPSVNRVISALLRSIEESRYSAADRPKDLGVDRNLLDQFVSQDTATQTTPFAASRSSSFDWIHDPTENTVRNIDTPLSTPRAHQIGAKTESSSDEADREVAMIECETEKRQNHQKYQKMDEGIALLLQYAEPDNQKQIHDQGKHQNSSKLLMSNRYDSLPTKLRPSDSVYDNMPWDRKRHLTTTGQFSPLVLPRNSGNSSFAIAPEIEQNSRPATNLFAVQLAERDANEACAWLKNAGFPQYVKQFEEGKFPIETSIVERDHGFLSTDQLRALFRRIDTLNRCAIMKVDNVVMRRTLNNDYLYGRGFDEDDNVALSNNWQYQRNSQTWNRVQQSNPTNETIYGGSARSSNNRLHVSTKPNWQLSYMEHNKPNPTADRHVSRTQWYEAAETRGLREEKEAKLQRSQSERLRDRARAIIRKMDMRSASKRRKESRHRDSPATSQGLVIGDPVLVSYDSANTDSLRMMNTARPTNLPERGRCAYPAAPAGGRSKSARRQGMILLTPSSPDSSDDSFGGSSSTSAMTSSSLIGGSVGRHHRRDCSMPPPARTPVRRYGVEPMMMVRRREPTPFDAYLYPAGQGSLPRASRNSNSSTLSRIAAPSYEPPPAVPPRDYGNNSAGLLQRSENILVSVPANNLRIHSDGYYEHGQDILCRRIDDSPSTSTNSSHLKVDVQKSESSVEHTDEEIVASTLHRRRDSGVGSSLSRSPSGPSNQRIRQSILQYSLPLNFANATSLSSFSGSWSNFKKRNASLMASSISSSSDETFFTDVEMARSMDSLSIVEMTRLRKLAYLQVSAILEKSMGMGGNKIGGFSPFNLDDQHAVKNNNNHWSVHKLMRKMKITDGKGVKDCLEESGVFGLSLDTIYKRTGFCLPRPILEILRFLRQMSPETVGIFRKNGVKSRIAELRAIADRESAAVGDVFVGESSLDSGQVHDVADLLKQYLRELPEPLMTAKMSETFANIFTHVPEVDRLVAVQYALLLMPDVNREAVQTLMMFLRDVAKHSQVNNMTAQNLAVCFTPSLFQLSASRLDKISSGSRRHKTIGAAGMPTEKEMKETRACQQCLTMLIDYASTIFMSPDCVDDRNEFEEDIPALKDLGLKGARCFLIDRVLDMIKDHADRWKSWQIDAVYCGVEISGKIEHDSHPLKTFRVWIDVEAAPKIVMNRIMKERHIWDTSVINWRHVEMVHHNDTDIHQYVVNETISHPTKDCHLVRFHSAGLTEIRGACAIAERSVQCGETQMLGGIAAAVLDQRFLIEPRSGGQSRVTYIARVDLKGRTWQWYNKVYGSIMCRQMLRLRDSFQSEDNNGPETKI